MSAIITGRVFWTEFKDLSYQDKNGKKVTVKETTAKVVMLAIGDSADDYGENSWQSFETIAKKASITRRSVIRVVRALIANGYLKVAGITQYGTNNFTVNKDILGDAPKKRSKLGRPKTSDSETKTSDWESPDPSFIHPESSVIDKKKPYDRKKGKEAAKERKAKQQAKRKDPLDYYIDHAPEITLITEMRKRVEDATGLRLSREWDKVHGDWNGYDKTLIKREVETGQTIEKFAEWFDSDEFRKNNQRIWLKPDKIELWWDEAMKWNGNSEEDRPEYKKFIPEEGNYVQKPDMPLPSVLRRKDTID